MISCPYPATISEENPSWCSSASGPLWPTITVLRRVDASRTPVKFIRVVMRLRAVQPPLPPGLLSALDELGIKTDADLIFYGEPMELYKKLPLGTVTLAELTKTIENVVRYVAAPGTRGDLLLQKVEQNLEECPPEEYISGVPELDKLTNGFGGSRVMEISGDRGSGKTVWQFTAHSYLHLLSRFY